MVYAMLPCDMVPGSERPNAFSCDYAFSSNSSASEGDDSCSSPLSIERSLLHRLYVVGIPDGCTEAALHALFSQHGQVRDLAIMYDKANGQCSGYAFVSFATRQEADSAIAELDDKVTLPGAHTTLRVRYAKNAYGIPLGAGPADNTKLHFSRVPRGVSRDAVVALFAQFDTVLGIEIFRGKNGCSMGLTSGLVTMATHAGAAAARRALDGHVMEGGCAPLKVQWSDPDMQHKKRRAQQAAEGRTLFFSRALTTATKAEIQAVFSQYGQVLEVVPFLVSKGSPFTRGCGLVMMGSQQEAAAAIEGLNGKFMWEGKDRPMVVVPLDMTLQERRRNSTGSNVQTGSRLGMDGLNLAAQAAMADALGSDIDASSALQMHQSMLLRSALATPPANAFAGWSSSNLVADPPPVGCDRDAYKLFVGNVPKACTEEHLRPLFDPYGKVIELVITRDKQTKASKGSAFVWYATKQQATLAAAALNKKPLDPGNPESACLVVRRANPRQVALPSQPPSAAAVHAARLSGDGGFGGGLGGIAGGLGHLGLGNAVQLWLGGGLDVGGQEVYSGSSIDASSNFSPNFSSLGQSWSALSTDSHNSPISGHLASSLRALRACPSAPAASLAAMAGTGTPTSSDSGLLLGSQPGLDLYTALDLQAHNPGAPADGSFYLRSFSDSHGSAGLGWQPVAQAAASMPMAPGQLPPGSTAAAPQLPDPSAPGAVVSASIALGLHQVSEAARHIHGVQSLTGAQVTLSTGPLGDFSLLLTGSKDRVVQARALLSSMLAGIAPGGPGAGCLGDGAMRAGQQQLQESQFLGSFMAPPSINQMIHTA